MGVRRSPHDTGYHYYKRSSILPGSRSMTMPPDFTNIIGNLRDAPVMNCRGAMGIAGFAGASKTCRPSS